MKLSVLVLLGFFLLPVVAMTAIATDRWKGIEASMVLTGTITVNPDGSVKGYTLHDRDKVPPGVVNLVAQTIRGWQFVPIVEDGEAVTAQAGMAVRVVAAVASSDAKQMTVRVAGAQFGCNAYQAKALLPDACPPDRSLARLPPKRQLPFPGALLDGVGGTVYLVVEVGRDGHVTRAAVNQVNLNNRVRRPNSVRQTFAKAALAGVRQLQYRVPAVGPEAAKNHWIVRLPINYLPVGAPPDRGYGHWSAYFPGPVQDVPWAGEHATTGSADAIAGGGAPFMRDSRFVLKTPLGTEEDHS